MKKRSAISGQRSAKRGISRRGAEPAKHSLKSQISNPKSLCASAPPRETLERYWIAARDPERHRCIDLIRGADIAHSLTGLCSALNALSMSNPAALEFLAEQLVAVRTAAGLISATRLSIEQLAGGVK